MFRVTVTYTTVIIAAVTYRFSSSLLDFVLKMPYTSEQHILATIYILTTNAFVLFANEIVGEPFIRLPNSIPLPLAFCSFALHRFMTRYPFHCSSAISIFNFSTIHLSTQNLFIVMIK
ncbi:unnamed protein product [Brugia timori]|uniref:Uncharacterized protein n=1 Tax=Brugia timori TaxID=42155 RepID=A0A3P7XAN2_9BILA|nr:unnamed protein product [Brugia timori]